MGLVAAPPPSSQVGGYASSSAPCSIAVLIALHHRLREVNVTHSVLPPFIHPPSRPTYPPTPLAEYCSRGSLYDCLAAARKQAAAADLLTWRRRLGMAIDAGAGLLYLHRRNIVHRDGMIRPLD